MSIQYKALHSNNYTSFSTFGLPLHPLSDLIKSWYWEDGKERVRLLLAVSSSAPAKLRFDPTFIAVTYSVAFRDSRSNPVTKMPASSVLQAKQMLGPNDVWSTTQGGACQLSLSPIGNTVRLLSIIRHNDIENPARVH